MYCIFLIKSEMSLCTKLAHGHPVVVKISTLVLPLLPIGLLLKPCLHDKGSDIKLMLMIFTRNILISSVLHET